MPTLPALRQLVFLAADLPTTLARAREEFGLKAGVEDAEGMAALGFIHEVLTLDQTFLEFTAPSGPETMPARLVAKRGDLGYMVVVQVESLDAVVERAAARGIAPVMQAPYEEHTISQWHPRDFGTLAEFDQIRPPESWHLAPAVFETGCTDVVGDVVGIELAVRDPEAIAATWSAVLDVAPTADGLVLGGRRIRFVAITPGGGEGLVAVELPATDRSRAGEVVRLSGVDFRLV